MEIFKKKIKSIDQVGECSLKFYKATCSIFVAALKYEQWKRFVLLSCISIIKETYLVYPLMK